MHDSDEMRLRLRGSLKLPVGIVRINRPINIYERALCNFTLDAREIIFPSTLRGIYNKKSWVSYGRGKDEALFSDRLERIELNEGLETIGTNVFTKCKYIKKITIPSSLMTIEAGAFNINPWMETIKFNGGLPTNYKDIIEFAVIENLGLTQLDLPKEFWEKFYGRLGIIDERTALFDIALYNPGEEEPYMHINPKKLCNCKDKTEMLLKLKKEYEEQER